MLYNYIVIFVVVKRSYTALKMVYFAPILNNIPTMA
jgi:hypothetical protein